jgi:hypothetical protein
MRDLIRVTRAAILRGVASLNESKNSPGG